MTFAEKLVARADKIDLRLGPIPGSDADAIARELRAAAEVQKALLEMLLAIKRHGELGCVQVHSEFPAGPTGGKKPASKDVWQFPRHMLVELDAAIAKATTP